MSTSLIVTLAVAAALLVMVVIVAAGIARTYNRLVKISNQTKNGFNQISVQLQRRYDLIPNLVECVRSYMAHESETLEAVIAARNEASAKLNHAAKNPTDASALGSLAGAEGALTGALNKMSFVMEDYPELKANETVATLTEELTSTENRIAFARQAYNDWATGFNDDRQSFPTITFASAIGFGEDFSLLEFEDAQAIQKAPEVSLV